MKKQITILAMACMGIFLPAISGTMKVAAQEQQKTIQRDADEFKINYLSSTDDGSKFSVRFSDAGVKNPTLKIYNEAGDEIYNHRIAENYQVFKVLTEEPAGTLTFALYDGKRKITSRTWQINSVSETRVIATESN
jgi:hypothetical protein